MDVLWVSFMKVPVYVFYEHLNLLVCYAMLTGAQSLTLRKSIVPSPRGQAV